MKAKTETTSLKALSVVDYDPPIEISLDLRRASFQVRISLHRDGSPWEVIINGPIPWTSDNEEFDEANVTRLIGLVTEIFVGPAIQLFVNKGKNLAT